MTRERRPRVPSGRPVAVEPIDSTVLPFLSDLEWAEISDYMRFSGRESEIARLILFGYNEETVATRLSISIHTVHSHVERLYRKLGIGSRGHLIIKLFESYVSLRSSHNIVQIQLTRTGTSPARSG